MKQKDIVIIVGVTIITGIFSYIISNKLFAIPKDQRAEVEVIEPVTADFPQPDKRYFNNKSVDPTESIKIGDTQNLQPFNESAN